MRFLDLSLVSFLIVAVCADTKNGNANDDFNIIENSGFGAKTWLQNRRSSQQSLSSSSGIVSPPNERSSGRQDRLDLESTIKNFVGYEAIQSALLKALKPKPIVDTALQSEKEVVNTGGNTQILGDLIVRGSETLSKAINTVIAVPKNALLQISKGATEALNQLGAYIVGI